MLTSHIAMLVMNRNNLLIFFNNLLIIHYQYMFVQCIKQYQGSL